MSFGEKSLKGVNPVSRETLERLTVFHDLLKQWQAHINLIAPSTVNEIWERHIADSLQSADLLNDAETVIDLGSGAGFPGLVMACRLAEKGPGRVEFVESVGKKCEFIKAVARKTGLKSAGVEIQVHNKRIEHCIDIMEKPDVISARALASLSELLKMSQHHLTGPTRGLFAKGRDHKREIAEAERHFSFDYETHPSFIEEGSVILEVSNVSKI